MGNDHVSMEVADSNIKYNVGEPVAVYAWIASVNTSADGHVTYDVDFKDAEGNIKGFIEDITDEDLTTVF